MDPATTAFPLARIAVPSPLLAPFVGRLWLSGSAPGWPAAREHILPTGQMHLVFRLEGPGLRVFQDGADLVGQRYPGPVIGGARSRFYIKEAGVAVVTIGAELLPGAAQALFGVSAEDLAGGHTSLSALWGAHSDSVLNQLAEAGEADAQLALLDKLLCARLPSLRGLHPRVAHSLTQFRLDARIGAMVERSAYSHRAFNALFKEAVGLTPKRYARLLRFQHMLERLRSASGVSLSDLALAAGYSDQAHMNREFREFAGVTPLQYRALAPSSANHLTLAGA